MNVVRCQGVSLWQWICKLAISGHRRKMPSGRVLLCGAVAFLWDRERIGNEDVIRYVYINRHRECTLCMPKTMCVTCKKSSYHAGIHCTCCIHV